MLVTLKDALEKAREGKYAVGAFNVTNPLCLSPIIKAAEKKNSPVIINVAEVSFPDTDLPRMYPAIIHAAKEAKVPVVVNLDHGTSEFGVITALRYGFSSIMFDATAFSYEENIELSARYARILHHVGVSLEGELGVIGGLEGDELVNEAKVDHYTDIKLIRPYVEATGVDALAVSIGNVHGFYKGEPDLQFELLENIASESAVPLVLHGGSGISDDDFRKAVSLGICKINFYTGCSLSAYEGLKSYMDELDGKYTDMVNICWKLMNSFQETVEDRMEVFGSAGKA